MIRALLASAVVILAAGAAMAEPTTRPDEGSDLDALIRQGEQAREQPKVAPTDPQAQAGQPGQEVASTQPEEEEDELVTALLGKAGGEGRNIMRDIIDNMGLSREQLRVKYDPGAETQRIQAKIIKDLDDAIAAAQQSGGGGGKGQGKGDKQGQGQRQPGQGQGQGKGGQPQTNRGNTAAADSSATHGQLQKGQLNNVIEQQRREWGDLPDRDRESVVQGESEKPLARWEAIIQRYYTALQVQSQNKE